MTTSAGPLLDGLRIVEVSAFVAAPIGAMTLAQLGAEVIRIDPLGGGVDIHRAPLAPDGTSLYWAGLNKNKRSVAIDLKSPEGRELASALATAPGPDRGIVLTNLPQTGWLSYDALRTRRDDMIMVALSGHNDGTTAVDYTVNAAIGLPHITGPADHDGVVNHVLPAWDLVAGLHLAVGILAAERRRARGGGGQKVDLALSDVAYAAMSALGFIAEAELGATRERIGNDIFGAYGRDFMTADSKRVVVAGITQRQWRSIVEATDTAAPLAVLEAELGLDFSNEQHRFEARGLISAILQQWFHRHDAADAGGALEAAGACWGPYRSVREMIADDPRCSIASPVFERVDVPGIGALLTALSPLRGASASVPAAAPPRFGGDTAYVLARDLGLSSEDLSRLADKGVIADEAIPA